MEEGKEEGAREEGEGVFSAPQVETASSFRPSRCETFTKLKLDSCLNLLGEDSRHNKTALGEMEQK